MDFEDPRVTEKFCRDLGVDIGSVLHYDSAPNYKRYSIRLGESDIAGLILAGCTNDSRTGKEAKYLEFGGDGSYRAWLCDNSVTVPDHYDRVAIFHTWLKVYDDQGVTVYIYAGGDVPIHVYRAGVYGCLIKVCK